MTPVAIRKSRDRRLEPHPPARADGVEDDVERDSNDSFPASDPPSWVPVARVGQPRTAQSGTEVRPPVQ